MKEKIKNIIENNLIKRDKNSFKGSYGKLLVYGGSKNYVGAPKIACHAALRSGVGYVTFLKTDSNKDVNNLYDEVTYLNYETKTFLSNISKYNAILFGNGVENNLFNRNLLKDIIKNYKNNLVIDATGIDILKSLGFDVLKNKQCNIIITPHIGEFKRLFNINIDSNDVFNFANEVNKMSNNYDISIILKSFNCLIASKNKSRIIEGKSPSLAKAGTGDALAGIIASLISYINEDILDVLETSYTILLVSSKDLESKKACGSLIISDIIENIPQSLFNTIKKENNLIKKTTKLIKTTI